MKKRLFIMAAFALLAMGIGATADTRSLVPRAAAEGSIGTAAKPWGAVVVSNLTITAGVTYPWNLFTGVITNGIGAASTTRLWIVSGVITNATTAP